MVVFVSIGSNLGDRASMLRRAYSAIENMPGVRIRKRSGIYETEPLGIIDQNDYFNAVLEFDTELPPFDLLTFFKSFERELGRHEGLRWGPREIDIDILLYGKETITEPTLIIPHPQLEYRRFVLVPFAEIAPETAHPVLGKTVAELLSECQDSHAVQFVYPGEFFINPKL